MDLRREPRFSVYGPVKATLLANPEAQLECVLLDISATGLKLISSASMPMDDILAIEADDHLALADVRYCQPRGDKFTIGCERIHVMQKASLPEERPKVEQIRQLVDEYRNKMRTGFTTPHPDTNGTETARFEHQFSAVGTEPQKMEPVPEKVEAPKAPEPPPPPPPTHPTSAFSTREQLLEAAADWTVEQWEKVPSLAGAEAGRSEIVDRLAVRLAEKLRARMPLPPFPSAPPPAIKPAPKPEESAEPVTPAKKKPQPVVEKKKNRAWQIPVGVAAAAVLGWGLSAVFWSLGTSGAASYLPPSIASLIAPNKPQSADPVPSVRHVQIKATEPTWMVATADGKRVFSKKLAKNDMREIQFSDKAVLHIANARGLEISLDGKPIGPLGGHGETRIVEFTLTGFRLLPAR